MTGRKRGSGLSAEDRALWNEVKKSVAPLGPGRWSPEGAHLPVEKPKPGPLRQRTPPPIKPAAPALAPMERRLRQRLARGAVAIDARLDLHGLFQEEARARLKSFLVKAQQRGHSVVLVITGKGRPSADPFAERGVLRRQVPLWLALAEFRPLVVGFEPSAPAHGGEGALYVRVRRARG